MNEDELLRLGNILGRDRIAALRGDVTRLETGQLLRHHHSSVCSGDCCLHGTSTHNVCKMPRQWRNDRNILEHVCPHGVGHTCPSSRDTVHGCDGCCAEVNDAA